MIILSSFQETFLPTNCDSQQKHTKNTLKYKNLELIV